MPGESQVVPSTGAADPSVFTTQAIDKGDEAERDWNKGQHKVLETKIKYVEKMRDDHAKSVSRALKLQNKELLRRLHDLNGEAQRLRTIQAEYWPRESAEAYIKEQAAAKEVLLSRVDETKKALEKATAESDKRVQAQIQELRDSMKEQAGGSREKLNKISQGQWVFGALITVVVFIVNLTLYLASHH